MKRLMLGTALSALIAAGAVAQTPSPPPASSPTPPAAAQSTAGKADFVTAQQPDQFLASKFRGTNVMGADNNKIGDVSDILFDKNGKIEAFVVSVGGFLGVGGKEVALAPSAFEIMPGSNGKAPTLKLSMTQDELKNAQKFARYEPPAPATTTGSGAGLNALPGNGSKPSSGMGH